MKYKNIEMSNKISLWYMKDEKYKSNLITVTLTMPLERETVTIDAIIPNLLKRGSVNFPSIQAIEQEMENMYGSTMEADVSKIGKNHVMKFEIESIKDSIVNDNLFEKSIKNLSELILQPALEKGLFKAEYVKQEKVNLENLIKDKINDKASYSITRCIEEMFKNRGYGIYNYGYIEDVENITNASIVNQYINILKTAKIDIYVSTDKDEREVKQCIEKYFASAYFNDRNSIYQPIISTISSVEDVKNLNEDLDVIQGKLVLGFDIPNINIYNPFDLMVLNTILGGGCNSKIFRNVREKEHLAYTARSIYIKGTNALIITAGIESTNYEKAISVIKKQIDAMKRGSISKKEIIDAKKTLINSYKELYDNQAKRMAYVINQNLLHKDISIENAIEAIEQVKTKDVVYITNKMKINTIYFLSKLIEG